MLPWITHHTPERSAALGDLPLAKRVREDLLDHILKGRLKPGQRISEPEVATRMQVSRVPVREALRELESSGLVVSRKHAGVFVRSIESAEVRDLYEMRSLLDGFAGRKAAALPDPDRRALVSDLHSAMAAMQAAQSPKNLGAYYAENLHFHWLIVLAAGNAPLSHSYQEVVQKLHLARLQSLSQVTGMRHSMAEHQKIAQAIAQGDGALAQQRLAAHASGAYARLSLSATHSITPPAAPKETP